MNNKVLRLHDLRRQFGRQFVEEAIQSKTFLHALREIRTNKIKIRCIKTGPCRAYYSRSKRTIYIGHWCPREYKTIAIAHEFVHALVKPSQDPIPGETGRQEFIDRCIDEETEAIFFELKCAADLLKAGFRLSKHEMDWYKCYRKGGRRGINRRLRKTQTSTTGESYEEYYGGWYDEMVPEHLRLP